MMDKCAFGLIVMILVVGISPPSSFAADSHSQAPYAGQQARTIKSLSADDIEALRQGRGWGFAKPAELNGYPGPLHVLELDTKLGLSEKQRQRIKAIFADMKVKAQQVGREFLAVEQALDAAFGEGIATPAKIDELTQSAAHLRAKLQSVHLNAHLLTAPLLSKAQLHHYAVLRGYAGGARGENGPHKKGSHSGH